MQGQGSVLLDAGSPFWPENTPFARCGLLWVAYNVTGSTCHFTAPVAVVFGPSVATVLSPTADLTSVKDFLFMSLEGLWDGVSCDFARIQSAMVHIRSTMVAYKQMELCSFQACQRQSSYQAFMGRF